MGPWFFLDDAWGEGIGAWGGILLFHRLPALGKKAAWEPGDPMPFFPLGLACFPQVLIRRFRDWLEAQHLGNQVGVGF